MMSPKSPEQRAKEKIDLANFDASFTGYPEVPAAKETKKTLKRRGNEWLVIRDFGSEYMTVAVCKWCPVDDSMCAIWRRAAPGKRGCAPVVMPIGHHPEDKTLYRMRVDAKRFSSKDTVREIHGTWAAQLAPVLPKW